MADDGEDVTPFWVESSANRRRRSGVRPSSLFLNSGVLLFLLCLTAVFFLFVVVPSVVSSTAKIFRPNLVKKSWDSINVVLVLFALLFGFLSRNRNYDSSFDQDHNRTVSSNEARKSSSSTAYQWYEDSDRMVDSDAAVGKLRRTYSSYPDLREVSPWDVTADDRWRFSDDTQVDAFRYADSDQLHRRRSWKRAQEEEEDKEAFDNSKTIQVDTLVIRAKEASPSSPPSPTASAPPALPAVHRRARRMSEMEEKERVEEQVKFELPAVPLPYPPSSQPVVRRKPKRTYESVAHKEKRNEELKNESETVESATSPIVSPSTSPPPATSSEKKSSKSDRKRGGANATKDFLTSLYHQGKKKKKRRQKSVESFETLIQPQAHSLSLAPPPYNPPPPAPPPPPPPPSGFHNLFSSKKGKGKKTISIPPPPPPPPPPLSTAPRASKTLGPISTLVASKPPLPLQVTSFSSVEENSNSGGESPLNSGRSPHIPIPPPPPPPPFKMRSWKFEVQGDYVRIGSMNSSRSGSPDLDDTESPRSDFSAESGGTMTAVDSGELSALFCPSPDVNTKADMFIAKFKAGLKLQKINSIKQKHGLGPSNLGPDSKPEAGPSPI